MSQDWTDRIVGARMAVDSEFDERLQHSEFSRQEWGLVMTAVEFDIEHPTDPDRAQIVADTSNLDAIMPELDRMAEMSPMGTANTSDSTSDSGGMLDSIKSALGFGGISNGSNEEKHARAEKLATEYAEKLQKYIEQRGKWDEIRSMASDDTGTEPA